MMQAGAHSPSSFDPVHLSMHDITGMAMFFRHMWLCAEASQLSARARGRESVREIVLTTCAWPLARERGEPGRSVKRGITVAPWMLQGSVGAASN
jgi:hypothetical protein